MTILSKVTAKTFFETGDRPSQTNFADLIDSTVFQPVSGNALLTGFVEVVSTASATAWSSAGAIPVTIDASAATARSLSAHLGAPRFHVGSFGAPTDGTDASAEIQNAIQAASDAGGGIVEFDPGVVYGLNDMISVSAAGVFLQGAGSDRNHSVGTYFSNAVTTLRWLNASAGTMLYITSPSSAAAQKLHSGGVQGIAFDANGIASRGLLIESRGGDLYDNLYFHNFATVGLDLNVRTDLGDANDTANNRFSRITVHCVEAPATAAIAIRLDGSNTANASFNYFENISIRHGDGNALQMNNSDNNVFQSLRIFRTAGKTGAGVLLQAGTSARTRCRANHFIHLSPGAGGVTSEGTASNSAAAVHNNIMFYDRENGAPSPTIEAGSELHWHTDAGTFTDNGLSQAYFGDSIAAVSAARSRGISTRSLEIINLSSNHMGFINNIGHEWSLSIDQSTGDFRVRRASGAAFFFDNGVEPKFAETTVAATASGSVTLPASAVGYITAIVSGQTVGIPFFKLS